MSELGIFYPSVPSGGNTQMRYYRGTVANPFGDAPPEDIVAICNGTIGSNIYMIATYHLTGEMNVNFEATFYASAYTANLWFGIGTCAITGGSFNGLGCVSIGWVANTDGANIHQDSTTRKFLLINNGEVTDYSSLIKDSDIIELRVYTYAE